MNDPQICDRADRIAGAKEVAKPAQGSGADRPGRAAPRPTRGGRLAWTGAGAVGGLVTGGVVGTVLAVLPYGTPTLEVVEGGLEIANEDGSDVTLIAHAAVVVRLDIETEEQ